MQLHIRQRHPGGRHVRQQVVRHQPLLLRRHLRSQGPHRGAGGPEPAHFGSHHCRRGRRRRRGSVPGRLLVVRHTCHVIIVVLQVRRHRRTRAQLRQRQVSRRRRGRRRGVQRRHTRIAPCCCAAANGHAMLPAAHMHLLRWAIHVPRVRPVHQPPGHSRHPGAGAAQYVRGSGGKSPGGGAASPPGAATTRHVGLPRVHRVRHHSRLHVAGRSSTPAGPLGCLAGIARRRHQRCRPHPILPCRPLAPPLRAKGQVVPLRREHVLHPPVVVHHIHARGHHAACSIACRSSTHPCVVRARVEEQVQVLDGFGQEEGLHAVAQLPRPHIRHSGVAACCSCPAQGHHHVPARGQVGGVPSVAVQIPGGLR